MSDIINPALVEAHARAWLGTPFVPGGGLRGVGADCIGLVRGLLRELASKHVDPPPMRGDWFSSSQEPILDGLAGHVVPVAPEDATAGHLITYRVGAKRAAHVAVLSTGGSIHAWEKAGVAETANFGREVTSAWALPCHTECETGPDGLTTQDCLAVIYPTPLGHFAEITVGADGTPLARTGFFADQARAVRFLSPIYDFIETVE